MHKKYLLALLLFVFSLGAKAQWVSIPDSNFVNYLNTFGFAQCMNGNQLDTTCSGLRSIEPLPSLEKYNVPSGAAATKTG